ncbi:MAG: hypothetical protein KatS3mg119_0721 [Rhodothalassiaceae bacterium]|nr:MAG: hypothetical protein KatS3mg119_0721 [Rhodothalassiaceae bacterium]
MTAPAPVVGPAAGWTRRSSRRVTKKRVPAGDDEQCAAADGRERAPAVTPPNRVVRRLDRRTQEAVMTAPAPVVGPAAGWTRRSSRRVTKKRVPAGDDEQCAATDDRERAPAVTPPNRVVRRLDRRTQEAVMTAPAPVVGPAAGWTRRSSRRVTKKKSAGG